MRKLYGIAEIHEKPRIEMYEASILLDLSPVEAEKIKEELKNLKKSYREKIKFSRKFIQKVNPKVIFCENRTYKDFMAEVGYKGRVIYLDDSYPVLQKVENYEFSGWRRLFSPDILMKTPLGKHLLKLLGEYWLKAFGKAIVGYWVNEEAQKDREVYWLQKILENYEEPSLLITGAAHLIPLKPSVGILPNLLREKGIKLEIVYKQAEKQAKL